jgi:hypothetical protein
MPEKNWRSKLPSADEAILGATGKLGEKVLTTGEEHTGKVVGFEADDAGANVTHNPYSENPKSDQVISNFAYAPGGHVLNALYTKCESGNIKLFLG